jgi:fumarate hydratase subunit beta
MSQVIPVGIPFTEKAAVRLRAGDMVSISGDLFTARDAAHQRLVALLERREQLPIELQDRIIYYVGPAPARPGHPCGPAGPTTSFRMDRFTPALLDRGLRGMLGKGPRSARVIESMSKNRAVYFVAVGGAAALLARHITRCEVVAYADLGTEAIHRLSVKDLPAIVAIDAHGNNLYETEPPKYAVHH